jgi:ATP-dependent DNA helicase DinG
MSTAHPGEPAVHKRFTPSALQAIRRAIEEAGGNEVLVIGSLDDERRISTLTVAARGHAEAVPALRSYLERGDVVIHNHPSGNLVPSQADLGVASRLGDQGIGFFIVDNPVERLYAVAEPAELKRRQPLDVDELAALLDEGGRLEQIMPGYEKRSCQIDLLTFVSRHLNHSAIGIAEAGTGVGKSLAYLIPAAAWISRNDERIVVSTATINLQQQLMEQDIPLVARIFGREIRAHLVKGRGNYLCLNRLSDALEEYSLFQERDEELTAIRDWALTSPTGSRTELSFYPAEETWARVCSEADACHGLRCRNREACFVLKSRRQAAAARLLVVNHHLLFSDLSLRRTTGGLESSAVLPPFKHIIFDEAHNIEQSATSFFSRRFSRRSLTGQCSRLLRRKKKRALGLLPVLERLSGKHPLYTKLTGQLKAVLDRAQDLEKAALEMLGERAYLRLGGAADAPGAVAGGEVTAALFPRLQELSAAIASLAVGFAELTGLFDAEEEPTALYESRLQLRRLVAAGDICDSFLRFREQGEEVFWLERQRDARGEAGVRFVITPLDIAPIMKEAVFEPYQTLLFTSATLTVNNSFRYWRGRVGLDEAVAREVEECALPSPFDFERNVLLAIPREVPLPDEKGYADYIRAFLEETLKVSEGRALVLFTSYSQLQDAYRHLAAPLAGEGIPLLRQGEDDRSRLLKRFRENRESVLLATDSFWEGVDAPGESLQLVILSRLPFRVPTHPVLQARLEAVRERGGNPFWDLSLPDAVMRLRQGFGRLVRSKTDKGVVIILDARIVNKSYGRYFLASLPKTRLAVSAPNWVMNAVEDFLAEIRSEKEHIP